MTNHSVLCGIRDCSRLQFSHRRERSLDLRPHFLEQIVRKFHTADVERETELTVLQEILQLRSAVFCIRANYAASLQVRFGM